MTPLIICLLVGIGMPTILALIVSWRETSLRPVRIVKRSSRARPSATVIIYHTDDRMTTASLRALRRLRAVTLHILIVVPAGHSFGASAPAGTLVHHKQRQSTRELTIASCYNSIDPSNPICIIDGGDILTAKAVYTALATFRRTGLQWLLYRRHSQYGVSFSATAAWFANAVRHVSYLLHPSMTRQLQAGTWLRNRNLLRNRNRGAGSYVPVIALDSASGWQLTAPNATGIASSLILLGLAAPVYLAGAELRASLPLVTFWVICAWWLNVLISLSPERTSTKVIPALCAPLGGILIPAACIVTLGAALGRGGQRLTRARRQHSEHRVFFRLRHP